jgi:hypothetical protein
MSLEWRVFGGGRAKHGLWRIYDTVRSQKLQGFLFSDLLALSVSLVR